MRAFVDGATVTWSTAELKCSANGCKTKEMCKHRLVVLVDRADRIPAGKHRIWIPMTREGVFASVVIYESDETFFRQVVWREQTAGYVDASASRLELRELIWPYVLQEAVDTRCKRCIVPAAMAFLASPPTNEQMVAVISTAIHIWNHAGICADCDDTDLIPPKV